MTIDLTPTTERVASLLAAIPDDSLDRPTPCPEYNVADLVDHVCGLTVAFRLAATKDNGADGAPSGDGSSLPDGWRDGVAVELAALAGAWRNPDAWTGMTQAGGVDLPGVIAGLVALNELVIHGWDLAVATGLSYEPDSVTVEAILTFLTPDPDATSDDDAQGAPEGLFGPPIPVPHDAPAIDRAVGLAGRDPSWTSPGRSSRDRDSGTVR